MSAYFDDSFSLITQFNVGLFTDSLEKWLGYATYT